MATLASNEIGQYREVGVFYDTCSFLGGEETTYFCLKIAYCGIEIRNTIKYINKTEITNALSKVLQFLQ